MSWSHFLGVKVGGGADGKQPPLQRVRAFLSYKEARTYMRSLRRSSANVVVGADADTDADGDGEGGLLSTSSVPVPETSRAYRLWAGPGHSFPRQLPCQLNSQPFCP